MTGQKRQGRTGKAMVVLAQAAAFPASAGLANAIAMPVDLWLPGPETAAVLLIGPETGDDRLFLAEAPVPKFNHVPGHAGNDTVGNDTVGNDTVGPGGNDTVGPGGNDTLDPGGNDTVGPGGNDTLDPGGNDTVGPGGNDTLDPGGNDTVGPGGNDTLDPGGNDTLDPGGNDTVGPEPDDDLVIIGGNDRPAGMVVLKTGTTNGIATRLREATEVCGQEIPFEYRIDCLRLYYIALADTLPKTGDYAPIRAALLDAADKLEKIVQEEVDPSASTLSLHRQNKPAAPRMGTLRAVKPKAAKKAAAEARAVVRETALIILRSGEDPTRRTAHYSEIAAAVEGGLVVLRSA